MDWNQWTTCLGIGGRHASESAFRKQWYLKHIVEDLRGHFPNVEFHHHFESTYMLPDGGILSLQRDDGKSFPILITEVKNQGTNELRVAEGKARQAKGNAIERLGKNVIGFRTAMISEGIFPFICFGDGCDFADDSSILDRVTTIAMFGRLNRIHLHVDGLPQALRQGQLHFPARCLDGRGNEGANAANSRRSRLLLFLQVWRRLLQRVATSWSGRPLHEWRGRRRLSTTD